MDRSLTMKLGFLTACLPARSLAEITCWAAEQGFESLEVAAWPRGSTREGTATHLDVASFDAGAAEQARALLIAHGLELSSIAYYDNNLDPDATTREAVSRHVRHCIDAAALLSCSTVGTFIGRDPSRSVSENLAAAERVFRPLVDYAGERGVKLVIENCVMESWHPDSYPGNLAYSPELWEWMFDLGLYLNYDPSHLVWLGIDPVKVIHPYVARIPHMQAKDLEQFPDLRNRYGFFGKTRTPDRPGDMGDIGWWRYRVPGLGQIDWRRLIDVLYDVGYDGVVSVEHEDPVWNGTEDRIKTGLRIAYQTLRPLIVA
jgi:sugar phosphate isomerase/epimerase